MMNSFATAISISLQYGVRLETLVRKFAYVEGEREDAAAVGVGEVGDRREQRPTRGAGTG